MKFAVQIALDEAVMRSRSPSVIVTDERDKERPSWTRQEVRCSNSWLEGLMGTESASIGKLDPVVVAACDLRVTRLISARSRDFGNETR